MSFVFYLFRRIDALLQGFLVLLRSMLSEPGDEKPLSSGFLASLDSIWSAQLQMLARSLTFLI